MLRSLLVVTVAAWAGLAPIGSATAEPVYPPGMRIGLAPPGEAKLSARFPGFEDAGRKVAITILDLPGGAYPDLEAAAFAKEQAGLKDFKREVFPFESGMGFLISGRAELNGVTLHKWFLLATAAFGARVSNLTTLITVEVPEEARAVYTDEVVRKALQSVTFRATPVEEQLGMLPFKLGDLAGFRVMQVLPEGGVILTDGPTDNINTQPYMIVGVGRGGPSEPSDRGRFARDMLFAAPVRELQVQSAEAMRIGGGPGFEIRATAKGLTADALSLVQWVRFGSGGFMRIVGVARTDQWENLFTRFRAVRDGIDTK
jgi:hypothetical protein